MRVEELLEALKSVLTEDRCVEFTYIPRRNEVVARVDIGNGIDDSELFAIYGILKELGFEDLWISGSEYDIVRDRYVEPEILTRAGEDVERGLIEFLKKRGNRFIVCKR